MAYLCPHPCDGKTEHGYCRYTWCINPLHSNLGTAYQGQGVQKTIITNADKIRAMSDEELAEWIAELSDCAACKCDAKHPKCAVSDEICKNAWLGWLRQEVKE